MGENRFYFDLGVLKPRKMNSGGPKTSKKLFSKVFLDDFSTFWAQKVPKMVIFGLFSNLGILDPPPYLDPIPLQNMDQTFGKWCQNTPKVLGLGPRPKNIP